MARGGDWKTISKIALNSNVVMTHIVVKLWPNAVTRAYRSSKVSPANSCSSLTSILYRDTRIVITTMASVSENLKETYEDTGLN